MLDFIANIIVESAKVFNDISFYLLLGLFLAGLIKILLPLTFLTRHLGKKDFKSVLKASLIGVPLPLCSCSVLPTAVALKKQGASNGATIAFLISTPETGIDSISVTYALLDPLFTILRPIAAFLTAFSAGSTVNIIERRDDANNTKSKKDATSERKKTKQLNSETSSITFRNLFTKQGMKSVLQYGYGYILPEIAGWLIIGILFAGLIAAVLPDDFFTRYINSPILAMLLMVVIGVPLYICATGSTPIAAALIAKGLNPGAALVFLLVGPATNISSFFVLSKYIKKKYLVVYLVSLITISLFLGIIVSFIYSQGETPVTSTTAGGRTWLPSWFKFICSIVLLYLLLRIFYAADYHNKFIKWLSKIVSALGVKPGTALKSAILLLIIIYILSGFFYVNIGETAIIIRFGNVLSVTDKAGLYYRLPYPFTDVIYESHNLIHTIEIGFRTSSAGNLLTQQPQTQDLLAGPGESAVSDLPSIGTDVPEEGLIFTGDENILNLDCIVHYRIKNPYKYIYKLNPESDLLRSALLSSIRRVFNRSGIMDLLVKERLRLSTETLNEARRCFDRLDIGVELISINFMNLHAPANVHYYFRDVASSMEDKERVINQAYKYSLDTVIRSKGEAAKVINEADSYKIDTISKSQGEAEAFLKRYYAYRLEPALTRFRMYLETAEESLKDITALFILKFKNAKAIELWLNTNEKSVFLPYKED